MLLKTSAVCKEELTEEVDRLEGTKISGKFSGHG